jgi:Fe-S cluster biogenesis protein NfuA
MRTGWTHGPAPLVTLEGGPMRQEVEKIIAAIRPAIQADEGDIELIDVDEETGVITVELKGACVTCPASTQTLKAGIERIMKDRVEGISEVIEINSLGMSESAVSL